MMTRLPKGCRRHAASVRSVARRRAVAGLSCDLQLTIHEERGCKPRRERGVARLSSDALRGDGESLQLTDMKCGDGAYSGCRGSIQGSGSRDIYVSVSVVCRVPVNKRVTVTRQEDCILLQSGCCYDGNTLRGAED